MAPLLAHRCGERPRLPNRERRMRKLQWSIRKQKAPFTVEKRPSVTNLHGIELRDDYGWLKAANWQEVLRDPAALPGDIRAVLEAENDYAQAMLAPAAKLQAEIFKEMRGRIKEDDSEVPRPDGPWLYYARHNTAGQYPVFCRAARSARGKRPRTVRKPSTIPMAVSYGWRIPVAFIMCAPTKITGRPRYSGTKLAAIPPRTPASSRSTIRVCSFISGAANRGASRS